MLGDLREEKGKNGRAGERRGEGGRKESREGESV